MVLQCTVDWGPVFVCHDKQISTLASQMLTNYYRTGPANQLIITSINLYTKPTEKYVTQSAKTQKFKFMK